jgi:hypothetical protein
VSNPLRARSSIVGWQFAVTFRLSEVFLVQDMPADDACNVFNRKKLLFRFEPDAHLWIGNAATAKTLLPPEFALPCGTQGRRRHGLTETVQLRLTRELAETLYRVASRGQSLGGQLDNGSPFVTVSGVDGAAIYAHSKTLSEFYEGETRSWTLDIQRPIEGR